MAVMLGAEGTLKETFASFMQTKLNVTLELFRGDPITGTVVGAPADEYVVIEAPSTSGSGTPIRKQFLVRYAAIMTITEGPVRYEERASV